MYPLPQSRKNYIAMSLTYSTTKRSLSLRYFMWESYILTKSPYIYTWPQPFENTYLHWGYGPKESKHVCRRIWTLVGKYETPPLYHQTKHPLIVTYFYNQLEVYFISNLIFFSWRFEADCHLQMGLFSPYFSQPLELEWIKIIVVMILDTVMEHVEHVLKHIPF